MLALGILLIVVGIGLIIGEFFTGTHILIALGIISLIFGLIFLATSGSPWFHVEWWLVAVILVLVAGTLYFTVRKILGTYHHQVTTGTEELKGKIAIVKEPLEPEGTVLYDGELWKARSGSGNIQIGEEVIITGVKGLKLSVIRKDKQAG